VPGYGPDVINYSIVIRCSATGKPMAILRSKCGYFLRIQQILVRALPMQLFGGNASWSTVAMGRGVYVCDGIASAMV
jgi:hypothetical protein